jgi:hypothetical protein
MAYTINLTNGNILTTVADGTINTTYSQVLVGKNYAGYGQFLDDNFVHLLESGANSTAPSNPLTGQLWFDTGSKLLKIYNGSVFKTISAATSSSTAPTGNNVQGDLWYNTVTQQLSVWTGTSWLVVGPSTTGGTGAVSTVITDISSTAHQVLELTVGNAIVGIVSKDTTFTPQNAIPGFTTVAPGLNLAANVAGNVTYFSGTATNALALNGVSANSFMRGDSNTSTTGTLSVLNNTGMYVGLNSDLNIGVVGTSVNIKNQTVNGNITFNVNKAGVPTTVMTINGSNGTISGNQINANYADVAERFAADAIYDAGTVVELGGIEEITKVTTDLSENVFGVISTRAAYLMNSQAGTNETHPPVAMTGRVPVKVKGLVKKGDRLVSAGNGYARAAQPGEATPFNVLGRSLVNKDSTDDGVVEAIVTIK